MNSTIDIYDESTWAHLVIPVSELTEEEQDRVFCYHAASGGDMVFLTTGDVICV